MLGQHDSDILNRDVADTLASMPLSFSRTVILLTQKMFARCSVISFVDMLSPVAVACSIQ